MTQQLRDARMWHLCKSHKIYNPKFDIDLGCGRFIVLIWHVQKFVRNFDQFAFYRCLKNLLYEPEPLKCGQNELIHRYVLATSAQKVYIRIPDVYGKNTVSEMRIMWLAKKTLNSVFMWFWHQKTRNGVYWWLRSQPDTPVDFMDGELRYGHNILWHR
jgi:hypothetical protein